MQQLPKTPFLPCPLSAPHAAEPVLRTVSMVLTRGDAFALALTLTYSTVNPSTLLFQ